MLCIKLSSRPLFLIRTPEQCPSVVSLLSESYNPHVRYGAAMALGICCAGTGNKVKPNTSGISSSLAPDCFPSQKGLCNSCENTRVVWSVRPASRSFPELPYFTVLDGSKPFKNKLPYYMGGCNGKKCLWLWLFYMSNLQN